MHRFRTKLDYWLKHNEAFNRLFTIVASTVMRFWGLFVPIDKMLIIFSGHSRKYNDSPRTIYEYMISHTEYQAYKYVWVLDNPDEVEIPGNPVKVKSDTVAYFKASLRAKYWITCVNIERGLHYKKKSCIYLNTWHGLPFKHVGNHAARRQDYDFSDIDYFCYASEYEKAIIMDAFNTRECAMIPSGLPRNDELYQVTIGEITELKKKLGLPEDKKIILYAPTWRDSNDNGSTYSIRPPINADYWEALLGELYIVLFRTHSYTNKLLGIEFNDAIRNYTSYPVVNDLLKVSDILISDYSALMADFSILERPILCFTYDYDDYKKERGLYLDYNTDMPSGILRTEHDVLNYIKTMEYQKECIKTRNIVKNKLTYIGGNATEICLQKIFGK